MLIGRGGGEGWTSLALVESFKLSACVIFSVTRHLREFGSGREPAHKPINSKETTEVHVRIPTSCEGGTLFDSCGKSDIFFACERKVSSGASVLDARHELFSRLGSASE